MPITIGDRNQQLQSDQQIRNVFNRQIVVAIAGADPWVFPAGDSLPGPNATQRERNRTHEDGRLGKTSVSKYRKVPMVVAEENMVVHVTFTIGEIFVPSLAGLDRDPPASIRVQIVNLHYTARPESVQLQISDTGDRAYAALPDNQEVATHRGLVNDWLHASSVDRMRNIGNKLGLYPKTTENLLSSHLDSVYTGQTLTTIQTALREALESDIKGRLEPRERRDTVTVEFA